MATSALIGRRVYVTCEVCGTQFRGRRLRRYCSVKCHNLAQTRPDLGPEYYRTYMREYQVRNRERLNAQKAAYKRAHRDMANETQRKRRAAGRGLGALRKVYAKVIAATGRCLACGSTERLEIDHVVPLSVGGSETVANYQVLCRRCNASKGIKTTDYREVMP